MNLVLDHMLESLIISWSQKNHDFQLFTAEAIIHDFIASKLVTLLMKSPRNFFNSSLCSLPNSLERCSVSFSSSQRSNLRSETLNQVANGHS